MITVSSGKRRLYGSCLLYTSRMVLGDHVEQAGQLVDEKYVRFDFTHFSALTPEELHRVETIVNGVILSGTPVECREMPIEEAKKLGAMALFGEKYGSIVRVVSVGDFSKEFCGGTHVDNTGRIGSVSYTHLDVYKRQLQNAMRPR